MKKIKIILLISIMITGVQILAQVRSAIYWTSPKMNLEQASKIAKFDLAIVDLENMINNKRSLDSLKKWNPKLILICYSNPMEIFDQAYKSRPMQSAWADTIRKNRKEWLLKTDKGKQVIFYPEMSVLNLSRLCPVIKGQTYGQFMDSILINKVLDDSIWDGYFMDNGTPNIYWLYHMNKGKLDADNNGLADDSLAINRNWYQGVLSFLKRIRQAKGPHFIMIANKGVPAFMSILDGRMFEDWPNDYLGDKVDGGWWQCMVNAHQTGDYTIFQISDDYSLDFAIASGFLLNHAVYVAVGQNDTSYYGIKEALKNPGEIMIGRKFQNGLIKVSPSSQKGEIFIQKK